MIKTRPSKKKRGSKPVNFFASQPAYDPTISIVGVSKTFLQANLDTVNTLSIEKITSRRYISSVDLPESGQIPAKLPSNPVGDQQN
jgi:hypothetical protein